MATSGAQAIAALNEELHAAGSASSGNDEILRSVLAASGDCIKILDLDGRLQFMSEGGKRVMEVDDFSALKGCPWPDFWEGEGNTAAIAALAEAKAGRFGQFKGAANTAKGTPKYWDVRVSPIFGPDDKPALLLSVSRDITQEWTAFADLERALEREALLSGEMHHRIKNTLAIVSAIARQTIQGNDIKGAREAFSDRLMALSQAHDILLKRDMVEASIAEIVDGALAPHRSGQGQIRAEGPDLKLQSQQALSLSLAVHELATNATKYGALSGEGLVDIRWSSLMIGGVPSFRFSWTESGGPPVAEPLRKGFGSRMIEKVLSADFAASVKTHYRPEGVECELIGPLAALSAGATDAVDEYRRP